MGSLSNLYISQSYQSLIHLSSDTGATGTATELQDGLGTGIGIYVNTAGALSASSYSGSVNGIGNVSAFSTSVDSRINAFQSSSVPAGTVSSSAQITALGFATTSSVTIVSASAWGAFQSASANSASAYAVDVSQSQQIAAAFATSSANSASAYQVDATQSFQITANALTASNSTTALSQSLFFTDTTQSVRINNLTALTGSTAYTNVNNTFNGTQSFDNVVVTGTASVAFLNVIYQSSSIIYSSGSNILGDEANVDTQTLIGRVIMSGSGEVTGSFKVNGVTTISSTNGTPLILDHNDASPTQNTLIAFLNSGSAHWLVGNVGTNDTFDLYNSQTLVTPLSIGQNNGVTFLGDITASGNISSSTISGIGNVSAFSTSVDSRLDTLEALTASLATTGSNSFVGNQTITGSVTISGSSTTDLTIVGQIFVSSSATGATTAPKITVSGSAGQSIINRNSISTRNTTNVAQLSPAAVFMNVTATSDEIGFSVDTSATPNWSTGASLYINNPTDTYPAVFGFQNKANYTDGRVTILSPLSASAGIVGNTSITGSLILSSSNAVELQVMGAVEITGSVATQPIAVTITSNTASIDFSKGSIYTLTLVSSSVATYVTASNLIPGQTANLLVTQASALSGSLVWASAFKFPSGSSYTGSKVVNAVDLVSFITVNNSTIYSVGAKNLI